MMQNQEYLDQFRAGMEEVRARMKQARKERKRLGYGIGKQEEAEFNWLTKKLSEAMRRAGTTDQDHPLVRKQVDKLGRWAEAHPEAWDYFSRQLVEGRLP